MKKLFVLVPAMLLMLASCGQNNPSVPSYVSEPGSDSASVQPSEPAPAWTEEQLAMMKLVYGEGKVLPYIALDTPVFEEMIGGISITSNDVVGEVQVVYNQLTAAGWSLDDITDNSTYGYEDETSDESFYIEIGFDETDGFSIYASYDYMTADYPTDLFAAAFTAAQAAVFPTIASTATGSFDTCYHESNIQMYFFDVGQCAAVKTTYEAALVTNGFVYNTTAGVYVNSTQRLACGTAGTANVFMMYAYYIAA